MPGVEVHPGAVHDTLFPYFYTKQPNTPTLAGQDVVVGKSYTEEGLFAKQHKLTNQEPMPWSWSR